MASVKALVIAAPHSGSGKTTVAVGLMAALSQAGWRVRGAKIGPDFIDTSYHQLATKQPSYNLDTFLTAEQGVIKSAIRAAKGAELLIIEGVMGLFDGTDLADPDTSPRSRERAVSSYPLALSSTAEVARLLGAPIVLVVDASSMSHSIAPLIKGFSTYHPDIQIAGVIANKVASEAHERTVRASILPLGLPLLGVIRRNTSLVAKSRHLGLTPATEEVGQAKVFVEQSCNAIKAHVDLPALLSLCKDIELGLLETQLVEPTRAKVAVAFGKAFSFMYQENLDLLSEAGADLYFFDPLSHQGIPAGSQGLILGGGFPELYLDQLAQNRTLLNSLSSHFHTGLPIWAECGGHLLLGKAIDGAEMAGVIDTTASMTTRLTLGYRQLVAHVDSPLFVAGAIARAHEFHYSTTDRDGNAFSWRGVGGSGEQGFAGAHWLSSYLHFHLGSNNTAPSRFLSACSNYSSN